MCWTKQARAFVCALVLVVAAVGMDRIQKIYVMKFQQGENIFEPEMQESYSWSTSLKVYDRHYTWKTFWSGKKQTVSAVCVART